MTLVHVADMADAFVQALESAVSAATYNVGAQPLRQIEHVTGLARLLGAPPPKPGASADRLPSHRCASIAIARDLGWQAQRGWGLSLRA